MNKDLHTQIGDCFRLIDKTKANKKLTAKIRELKVKAIRKKIEAISLTLQRMEW